jgi:hypothetical protein
MVTWAYRGSISMAIQRRLVCSAAMSVEPEPANGS